MTVTSTVPVVVVGVDGSTNADAAVQWAQSYAESTGAVLRLVVAWDWPMSYGYPMVFEGFDPEADAIRVAEKAAANLVMPPTRIETLVQHGSAGEMLVKAGSDADLLVVGRRGAAMTTTATPRIDLHNPGSAGAVQRRHRLLG
jgi:nucleotide-binding universal stress UspA family protein